MLRMKMFAPGEPVGFGGRGGIALFAPPASATPTPASETKFAGTGANDNSIGIAAWSQPTRITADDGLGAGGFPSDGETTNYLKGANFGFTIPPGATIDGVIVSIERRDSDGTDAAFDNSVKLVKGGTVSGNNKADTGTAWPSAYTVKTYGSSSDLWGLALTPADVNASDFGVVLAIDAIGADLSSTQVDYISITVHYTA